MGDNIDWGKSASGSRETYPTGTYKVEITSWQETTSSKGTPQVRWFTKIEEPGEYNGKTLVDHTPLTESSLWRIANLVKACGVNITGLPVMEIGSSAFKQVLDACVHRKTVWNIIYDEQYQNNKVQECLLCETELIDVAIGSTDDACPI